MYIVQVAKKTCHHLKPEATAIALMANDEMHFLSAVIFATVQLIQHTSGDRVIYPSAASRSLICTYFLQYSPEISRFTVSNSIRKTRNTFNMPSNSQ